MHIYALIDPRTDEIRYVGRTLAPLDVRLYRHINWATNTRNSRHPSYLVQWLSELLDERQEPRVELLEEVEGGRAHEAEVRWMRVIAERGVKLVNTNSYQLPASKSQRQYRPRKGNTPEPKPEGV